jgi:hypothetical protein
MVVGTFQAAEAERPTRPPGPAMIKTLTLI